MKKSIKSALVIILAVITLMMPACNISVAEDEHTKDHNYNGAIESAENGWFDSPDDSSSEATSPPKIPQHQLQLKKYQPKRQLQAPRQLKHQALSLHRTATDMLLPVIKELTKK